MTVLDAHGNLHNSAGLFSARRRSEAEGTLMSKSTLQTSAPLTRRSLSASNRSAREVARQATDGDLILDPPYQRPSVWSELQQRMLVRSWAESLPIPAVTVNDRGHEYAVVDGKQRIETAVAWFTGQLTVPATWFPTDWVGQTTITDDGPYVTFTGLTVKGQRLHAAEAFLPVIEAHLDTVAEEAELYVRLNTSGTEQATGDIQNARRVAGGA